MLLYGNGGHSKAIISSLHANGTEVHASFDDAFEKYDPNFLPYESLIISIGDNAIRQNVAQKIVHPFGRVIHPSAIVEISVSVGDGTVILHRCVVQSDVQIGKHVIVNTAAVIEHDCIINDFVHLAPGSMLCGNVRIGEGTLIGAGSVVVQNIKIGKNCLIAAGSTVTVNVPDGAIVRGNPAKVIKILKGL